MSSYHLLVKISPTNSNVQGKLLQIIKITLISARTRGTTTNIKHESGFAYDFRLVQE
jgi:hypothetical protein